MYALVFLKSEGLDVGLVLLCVSAEIFPIDEISSDEIITLSLLNVSCVSSAALLIYIQINVTVIVMCLGGTKDGPAKYCSDIIGIQ